MLVPNYSEVTMYNEIRYSLPKIQQIKKSHTTTGQPQIQVMHSHRIYEINN